LAVFPDQVREFKKIDRHPDFSAMQDFEAKITQLADIDIDAIGAIQDIYGASYLRFSAEAQPYFDLWRAGLEARLRDPKSEEHPAMLAHLGKYRSLVPKIALVLHLAAGGSGPVGLNAVRRAIGWAKFLEAHARRIYHTASNRTMHSACALANKIKSGRMANGFTRSDVLTKDWSGLRTAEEVGFALTVLRDKHWIVSMEDRRTGGRPTERFYINPSVKIRG
jgi:putative DNA primase/helicase